jgi:o-succinylbenzoate synthase
MTTDQWPNTDPQHIIKANAYWLKPKLTVPYENALCRLEHFDVMLIELIDAKGRSGWGEACPVLGYSPESPQQAWHWMTQTLPTLLSLSEDAFKAQMFASMKQYPFVVSAFYEAYSDLLRESHFYPNETLLVPLIGTVNSLDPDEAPKMALELINRGYKTLKVKVGYEPESDAQRVNNIMHAIEDKAKVRMDANQGYSLSEAIQFARRVSLASVEYFEQPLHAMAWDDFSTLVTEQPLPIMLDESIYGDEDIERASDIGGIAALKLKMSKSGGPQALAKQVQQCQQLGFDVVIGNGVATDLGCYHEGALYHHLKLTSAAEMNGFLKITERLLAPTMTIQNGNLSVPDAHQTAIAHDVIDRLNPQSHALK